jgi:integrase
MQYRLGGRGSKKERVTLGEYPAHTLSEARLWREQCRALLAHGRSPAATKQAEKAVQAGRATDTVAAFANLWYADVVSPTNSEPRNIRRVLYQSSIRRPYKLALHLLVLCRVRKGELIGARWEEIDFDTAEWLIPAERMKKDKPHLVPLSKQAVAMIEELKGLAGHSPWVLPSRNTWKEPIAHSTLNQAIRSLELGIRDFAIRDFRRTASTQLHEAGFNSDWIEKALAEGHTHEVDRSTAPRHRHWLPNGPEAIWLAAEPRRSCSQERAAVELQFSQLPPVQQRDSTAGGRHDPDRPHPGLPVRRLCD